ncbi:HNH endonuclease [Priestia megaterium]|uniref:HNH endonuclease n=1 Tax=Priestia megaterium TaxID=1404 RepID=UPI0039ECAFE0
MNFNKFCSCGQLVAIGATCDCKKVKKQKPANGWHPSSKGDFRKLRKLIIKRDGAHCQRCRIKYNWMVFDNLEAHHIKSWRDYPELGYDESNLITVCKKCNLELGNSNKLDFEPESPEETQYCL